LMRAKNPSAFDAARVAISKMVVEDPLVRAVEAASRAGIVVVAAEFMKPLGIEPERLATTILLVAGAAPADWAESAWRAVFSVFATGLPLFALSGWLFHSAAPGVHLSSAPTQSAPELPAPPKPVRLTVGGAKQP